MNNSNDDPKTKLVLKNVYAPHVNEKDEKYNRSIAVVVYDEVGGHIEVDKLSKIAQWVKENNIGSGDTAGKPYFYHSENEVESCKYFYFKPGSDTEYTDLNGQKLTFSDIKPYSKISLVARAFPYKYKNNDGKEVKGVSHRLSSVIVMEMGKSKAYEDTKDLLDELITENNIDEDTDCSEVPF